MSHNKHFFCDANGNVIFKIINNEWQILTENWDVKTIGNKFTILNAARKISLEIIAEAPGKFAVEKIDMEHKGIRLNASNSQTKITSSNLNVTLEGCSMSNMREINGRFEIG